MLLLISPINREEALESIEGGADIVDVIYASINKSYKS